MGNAEYMGQFTLKILGTQHSNMKLIIASLLACASAIPIELTPEVAEATAAHLAAVKLNEAGEHAALAPVNNDVQAPAPVHVVAAPAPLAAAPVVVAKAAPAPVVLPHAYYGGLGYNGLAYNGLAYNGLGYHGLGYGYGLGYHGLGYPYAGYHGLVAAPAPVEA